MIPQLELYDGCLVIIYLFVIYLGSILYVQKKRKENSAYRYFIPALSLKLLGGIVYALYHVYVYRGGDTFAFFEAATDIQNNVSFFNSSFKDIYLSSYDESYYDFTKYQHFLAGKDVLFIVKIISVFGFLGLKSYYTTTLLFALFSFSGLWKLFQTFNKIVPEAQKIMFYAIFTLPTMLLWSSGILKDTITIGAIGWIVYSVANIFIFNKPKLSYVLIFLISSYFIFVLKPYLLYILLPSLFVWIQSNIKEKITSSFIKMLITPLLLILLSLAGYYVLNSLSLSAGKYSLDNWQSTLQGFHSWHEHLSESRDQSGYSLGEIDYTIFGMLTKIPAALNVTFFRPYLWEVRNIATLLGALEGLLLFLITVFILFKVKLKVLKLIVTKKEILFLLSFALPFAFIVGLSSYNFGALSRYKIPAELFYLIALALLYHGTLRKET